MALHAFRGPAKGVLCYVAQAYVFVVRTRFAHAFDTFEKRTFSSGKGHAVHVRRRAAVVFGETATALHFRMCRFPAGPTDRCRTPGPSVPMTRPEHETGMAPTLRFLRSFLRRRAQGSPNERSCRATHRCLSLPPIARLRPQTILPKTSYRHPFRLSWQRHLGSVALSGCKRGLAPTT